MTEARPLPQIEKICVSAGEQAQALPSHGTRTSTVQTVHLGISSPRGRAADTESRNGWRQKPESGRPVNLEPAASVSLRLRLIRELEDN